MADQSRLDDLRRRVEKDPASIAFAQLAEEYRRAGLLEQAVEVCRAGLRVHAGYLSARVTLGRALLELNQLEEARRELEQVLQSAPENLAAIRGLAEIHHRLGHLEAALAQYRTALALARNDPDLQRTVEDLAREISPEPQPEPPAARTASAPVTPPVPAAPLVPVPPAASLAPEYNAALDATTERAHRTIAALTKWLDALNVSRPDGRP